MRHLLLILSCLWQESTLAFQGNRTPQARAPPLFSSASTAGVASKHAIVVGGGPVGLATALTLSSAPHFYRVTILEQTKGTGLYDPSKAYLYNVNARGQEWTQQFPAVQTLLRERGSSTSMGGIVIVPADPNEPIPEPKIITTAPVSPSTTAVNYWIPRHTMTVLLEEVIAEQESKRRDGSIKAGKVELLYSKECRSIQTSEGLVEVTVQDTKDPNVRFEETYKGDLLIGADGMNSAVRNCLADDTATKTTWLNANPKQFRLKTRKSPATDLRMRVLQFPSGFEIPNVDGKILHTSSEAIYAIRSAFKGSRNYLSLGLLPIKDASMVRPTNVITRPNHELWSLKTGAETKAWFTRAFPRLKLETMIPDEEWDRFAKAQGTTFPPCQYCPKLQVSHPSGQVGVALVGDSLHAFPPDIGQGINAGLGDVVALDRALQGRNIVTGEEKSIGKPSNLGEALQEYERVRGPEIKALIRIARFGSPYQYRQPLRKDRIGRFLWTVNVAVRLLLNKCSGGLMPKPAIMLMGGKELTFRQVMRRADVTTFALSALVFGLFWKIFLGELIRTFFV